MCIRDSPTIEISIDGKIRYVVETYEVKPRYSETLNTDRICYYIDNKPRHALIPYLVANCYVDNPNGYNFVRTKDGDVSNYHASNLEWVRSHKGKKQLTPEEVKENKRKYNVKYREEHLEDINEKKRIWYNDNRELIRLKACEYWDKNKELFLQRYNCCLLYTSPSPRDLSTSRMPSSA